MTNNTDGHAAKRDPYDPDAPYYECVDCHHRVDPDDEDESPEICPECGGNLRNINVPREE